MTQDQKPASPSQQSQKQVKDSGDKMVGTSQDEWDPRSELGLKSPVKESENSSAGPDQQKATQFNGNPNPQGAPSSSLGPKDDIPVPLGKESRNDQ